MTRFDVARLFSQFAVALTGFLIYWPATISVGIHDMSFKIGKDVFVVLFSASVFMLLYAPLIFFGHRALAAIFKYKYPARRLFAFCFSAGFACYPAILIATFAVTRYVGKPVYSSNAIPAVIFFVLTGLLVFLVACLLEILVEMFSRWIRDFQD